MSGRPSDTASPFANDTPTSSEPMSPGPKVTPIAESSSGFTPARFNAWSIVGTMFFSCAREANSGTTPPYASCTACEAVTLLSRNPSCITAADVSSQLDSIPNMVILFECFCSAISVLGVF